MKNLMVQNIKYEYSEDLYVCYKPVLHWEFALKQAYKSLFEWKIDMKEIDKVYLGVY